MSTYTGEEDQFFNAENKMGANYQALTFTNRFMSVLRSFNFQRLIELNSLIYEAISTDNKEIYECFKVLVEDIFSVDKETNWNLLSLANPLNNEFNCLYSFLNADGDLFKLIKYLMGDSSLKFSFPVSKLPVPSRILIEQGITPNFYLHKVCANSVSIYPEQLSLNPFEFFFFNFAYYAKNLNRIFDISSNDQVNLLYLRLLEDYLVKFLPSNNKCVNDQNVTNQQNSLWQSLSSTTSTLLHLGKNTNKSTQQDNSLIQKPSLLNIKPLQNFSFKQTEDYNQKSFDSLGSIIYKCETIINILTEMWLNINVALNINKKKGSSTTLIKNNCPNVIYMMGVRVFIKRLHAFANSITDKSLEMGNMPAFENHELDEIKKSVWSSKYQIPKKFFSFLKLSFEHWPCDSSFRMPLETWLSYIQPWRYVDELANKINLGENQGALSNSNNGQQMNLNKWKNFIQENILFYTVIYKEVITRFINLDLLSLNNVYMLFRVPKVYFQTHLTDLIREAEANCENVVVSNSWLASASLRGSSLLSPNVRNNSQSICNKDLSFTNLLEDNEKNGFVYVSFFSDEQKKVAIRLIGKIISSIKKLDNIQLTNQESSTNRSQIADFFYSLFDPNTNTLALEKKKNLEEMNKIRQNLEICKDRLIKIYELDLNELECLLKENDNFENLVNVNSGDRVDSVNDQSTLNRENFNQTIINPFTRDKIEYNGNPDLQPVRTYEFYYLNYFLIYLSQLINGYYGEAFERYYVADGILGYLARFMLAAPHEYTVIEKNGQVQKRVKKKLPARVNLRFLASITFYIYSIFLFGLFYIFLKLFLFKKSLFFLAFVTFLIASLLVKLIVSFN